MSTRRKVLLTLAVCVVSAVVVAGPTGSATAEQADPCDAWDVEYTLAGRLQLSDTPMGAGNGIYTVGPGSVVLRFANVNGQPGGAVRMRSYAMREHFAIESHAVFWTTHVLTDTKTVTAPDACGTVANGQLEGKRIRWFTSLSGYRTDGSLTCDGSLCGKFGAPPPGKSEFHVPPHAVPFGAFDLGPDTSTFTMKPTFVAKTESPQQTAHIALGGREVRRTCVRVTPCP